MEIVAISLLITTVVLLTILGIINVLKQILTKEDPTWFDYWIIYAILMSYLISKMLTVFTTYGIM